MTNIRTSRITGKDIKMDIVSSTSKLSEDDKKRIFDALIESYDRSLIDILE